MTMLAALTLTPLANAQTPHRTHQDAVVSNLRAGLAGTPMYASVVELEKAAKKYDISPYFIAAVAGVESGYGRLHCQQSRYWVFGLGSCGRAWTPPYFTNWRQTYSYFARFLRDRWIARGARSAHSIGRTYCPPCGSRWGEAVEWHMSRHGWPKGVTY